MKEVKLFSGQSYIVDDGEVPALLKSMADKGSIYTNSRLGLAINSSSIASVADPEVEPYFWGNKMNKAKTQVLVDGEWKTFAGKPEQIEYRLKNHPDTVVPEPIKKVKYDYEKNIEQQGGSGETLGSVGRFLQGG